MINVLMPMAGKSLFFQSEIYRFPKPFVEVEGRPMIEHVMDYYRRLGGDMRFVFIINQSDCDVFHLDRSLQLLCDSNCVIVRVKGETKGAACSCLLAIEHINNDDELIIANSDQIILREVNKIVSRFHDDDVDAGVLTFESVHPQWSYARLGSEGYVVETAEKKPISMNAIAGFYYFKKGSDFVTAAMSSILKDANTNGIFYIAPTINELILSNKKVGIVQLERNEYHSLYSPQKIAEYESKCSGRKRKEDGA